MANDHYAVCEAKRKYYCLGEFYEGDVGSADQVVNRMKSECHQDRLNNGTGVMFMLCLCAFMRRCRPHGVRILDENEFWDLRDADRSIEWFEDKLTETLTNSQRPLDI